MLLSEATAQDYHSERHQGIYEAMHALGAAGKHVDYLSLARALDGESTPYNENVVYLSELVDGCPAGPYMMRYYLDELKETGRQRELLRILQAGQDDVRTMSTDEALDLLEGRLELLDSSSAKAAEMVEAGAAIKSTFAWIESYREGTVSYLKTGFDELDSMVHIDESDLVILAARPSVGKTALALNIASNVCCQKVPVLFFSMEMPSRQLMIRVISAHARTDYARAVRSMSDDVYDGRVLDRIGEIHGWPLTIDDSGRMSIAELCLKARRVARKRQPGLIIVDYLQELKGSGGDKRQGEIEEAAKELKALAKELGCPVLCLSQLNRESEKRKAPPGMSDLRDSGGIEQAADSVMILHRERDEEGELSDIGNIYIRKARNGTPGKVGIRFHGAQQRFEEMW